MKTFCIVGTDTDVGKTIVSAGIANYFKEKQLNFNIQKWVSTGDKEDISQDLIFTFHSLEVNKKDKLNFQPKLNSLKEYRISRYNNPFSYNFPASPHLSAQLENKKTDLEFIEKSIKYFKNNVDYLIIEGVGGLMVPLSREILLIDLIKKYSVPVIIVTPNVLGTINKTLLSIKALKEYKIRILGLIYNNFFKENTKIQEDNMKTIKIFSNIKKLGKINIIKTKYELIKNFQDIGKKLLEVL